MYGQEISRAAININFYSLENLVVLDYKLYVNQYIEHEDNIKKSNKMLSMHKQIQLQVLTEANI